MSDQSKIIIKTTGFADGTKLYLVNHATSAKASGFIRNNKLIFSVEVDEPTMFTIRPNIQSRADIDSRLFWKEDGRVTIHAEKGNLKNAIVDGSQIQKHVDAFNQSISHLQTALDRIIAAKWSAPIQDIEKRDSLKSTRQGIQEEITEMKIACIRDHPDNIYSAFTLRTLMDRTIPKSRTADLYRNLSPGIQSSRFGITIRKFLELSMDFKVGDKATDFQLPDLEGNLVGLSSFKNKYVLLDFWSANCGPCRLENPNLLRNHQTYHKLGFEILSVSLDKSRADWENAVKKDNMIWTTVSDLQGTDGDVPMTYNVYFIPTYYLIDPNGIIIDKFLGRGQLDAKLEKIFPPREYQWAPPR